jgi:tRNA modification GTPase
LRQRHPETPVAVVVNKIDSMADSQDFMTVFDEVIPLSALRGEGLPHLMSWLSGQIDRLLPTQTSAQGDSRQAVLCLTQRQSETLSRAQLALTQAAETLEHPSLPLDLVTVSLSESLHALGNLLGTDSVEAVLDDVFSKFCVGK